MRRGLMSSSKVEALLRSIRSWSVALLLLTAVSSAACAGQAATRPDADLVSAATTTAAAGDAATHTATPPPSLPPSPPPPTQPATPTRPATSRPNTPATPSGLEPTAEITVVPPTLTRRPTPTPVPTSSIVPGWLTYENEFLGYSFSYPPEATIGYHGTTEEPPENITTRREYLAWEETVTPNNLCVRVGYKTGFVTVGPADEPLSLYASPCGITGIGDYTIEEWEEVVTIDGQPYTAGAMRLYIWQTDLLEHEYYLLRDFNNDLNIDFGLSMRGASRSGQQDLTEAEFNEVREILLQIVASFRF